MEDVKKEKECFVCGRPLDPPYLQAATRDGQAVYVGPGCHGRVLEAGKLGWQPKVGPRLYPTEAK